MLVWETRIKSRLWVLARDEASAGLSRSSVPLIEDADVERDPGSNVCESGGGACDDEGVEDICCDGAPAVSGISALAAASPQPNVQDALAFESLLSEALHVAAGTADSDVVPAELYGDSC